MKKIGKQMPEEDPQIVHMHHGAESRIAAVQASAHFPGISMPQGPMDGVPAEGPLAEAREDSKGLSTRNCKPEDIPRLVDIDTQVFDNYREYDMSEEELREDLLAKFQGRYDLLGSDWIRVVEREGEIVGFMMSCPTDKEPEDFVSWEDMTDNGTLEATYDPEGKNAYVVTLSMLPGQGELAQNMLFGNQVGKMIQEGYEKAFFESRLPGLREWATRGFDGDTDALEALSEVQKFELAQEYANTRVIDEESGKEEPIDKLMKVFHRIGCTFAKVVPDAYDDAPSMNFGVLTVYENPMLNRSRVIQTIAGTALRMVSNSKTLMKRAF